jgi:hypothetical protein
METLQRTANRGSISTGYDIDNSLKLEQPERITRGYSAISQKTSSDRKRTTLSYWVKRTQLNASGNGIVFIMYAGNTIMLGFEQDKLRVSASYGYSLISNALFRDTSAWYHLVFSIDTTQGTANDRVKVYVNGAEYTDWSTQTITISQNANNGMFNEVNGDHYFGWSDSQATGCYVAEAHCIDGQALTASDFGEYDDDSGIWIPKEYEGTYGNQGYYLDFKNASSLTDDSSGNGNNFTNFYAGGAENQATDTPTNNFCTLNPLLTNAGSANYLTMTEGATKGVNAGNAYRLAVANMGVTSGKWYWEVKATSVSIIMYMGITYPSIWDTDYSLGGTIFLDDNNDPVRYNNSSRSSFGSVFGNGDIIAFALDMDASTPTMTVYKNNSSLGNLMAGLSIGGTGGAFLPPKEDGYFPKVGGYGAATFECNFGGYTSGTPSSPATDENGYGTFEYAPPSGYYALCTKNLAEYG